LQISNFSPILELIVALNIAYASIPQLAKTINDLFFDKLKEKVSELEQKVNPAKHNLGAINKDDVTDEIKAKIIEKIDSEISDTLQIKDNIEYDVEAKNKIISSQMRLYYILVSILSLGYLYIDGISGSPAIFPTYKIVNLYLLLILFCVTKNLYTLKKDRVRNILLFIFTVGFIVGYYFLHDFLCVYMSGILIDGNILIHLLLILSFIPLTVTIIRYFLSSNEISKKYKEALEKQLNDIDGVLEKITDVAKKPVATKLLNKVVERHKDKNK